MLTAHASAAVQTRLTTFAANNQGGGGDLANYSWFENNLYKILGLIFLVAAIYIATGARDKISKNIGIGANILLACIVAALGVVGLAWGEDIARSVQG